MRESSHRNSRRNCNCQEVRTAQQTDTNVSLQVKEKTKRARVQLEAKRQTFVLFSIQVHALLNHRSVAVAWRHRCGHSSSFPRWAWTTLYALYERVCLAVYFFLNLPRLKLINFQEKYVCFDGGSLMFWLSFYSFLVLHDSIMKVEGYVCKEYSIRISSRWS